MPTPPLVRVEGKSFGAGSTLTADHFLAEEPLKRSSKSNTAREAETAFDLGDSLYFFAGHACPDFGDVVLAYAPDPHDGLGGGATPFDTGGFLSTNKRIYTKTLDGLSGAAEVSARREYVVRAACALGVWRREFATFVGHHFSSSSSYIEGEFPLTDDSTGRLQHPKNKRRAWTWEIRLHADHALFENLRCAWVLDDFYERLRQEVLRIEDDAHRKSWLDRLSKTVRKVESGTDLCGASEKEMASWK